MLIPKLKNTPVDDATKQLTDKQLNVKTEDTPSRTVDEGNVVRTLPEEGTRVDCNSTVTLFVSKGANTIDVPSVVGEQRDTAASDLRKLGLIVRTETRDADEPEGQVISQDPAAGAAGVVRGDTITLTVSNGEGSLTVPSVVGLTADAARSQLTSVGLNPDVVSQDTDQQAQDGRVLDQAPESGTRAHSGDTVTIVVAHFVEPSTSTTTTSTTSTTSTTTTTGP